MLFEEGAARSLLAIVISGSVAIEKQMNGRPIRLVTLGAGEAVGEGLLLDDSKHGTSARALQSPTPMSCARRKCRTCSKSTRSSTRRSSRAPRAPSRNGSPPPTRPSSAVGARSASAAIAFAVEHDLLGEREMPDEALYGVQTLRALENFPITGVALREFPTLVEALAAVKEAAALANAELGLLAPDEVATRSCARAREIRTGRHHEHFLVDMIQGGAGTSTNMNANEVIANRALELLGQPRGDYAVISPNTHVNLSQSTNDVYPTAMKLALHSGIEGLRVAMRAARRRIPARRATSSRLSSRWDARSCRTRCP